MSVPCATTTANVFFQWLWKTVWTQLAWILQIVLQWISQCNDVKIQTLIYQSCKSPGGKSINNSSCDITVRSRLGGGRPPLFGVDFCPHPAHLVQILNQNRLLKPQKSTPFPAPSVARVASISSMLRSTAWIQTTIFPRMSSKLGAGYNLGVSSKAWVQATIFSLVCRRWQLDAQTELHWSKILFQGWISFAWGIRRTIPHVTIASKKWVRPEFQLWIQSSAFQ